MAFYTQLTQEERYHISVLCKEGFSKTEIAKRVPRQLSTIGRELKRNTGKKGYRAKHTHQKALERRHTSRKAIKFSDKIHQLVDEKIKIYSCSRLTEGIKERFITVTVDNGREFTGHEELTSKLGVDVYFTQPYHSWERGTERKHKRVNKAVFSQEDRF